MGKFQDKVNEGKSETMMITGSWPTQLDRLVRFRWAKGDFRYLGVILTPIFFLNYTAQTMTNLFPRSKMTWKGGRCFPFPWLGG